MEQKLILGRSADYSGVSILTGPIDAEKSALALSFAYHFHENFAGVCWCYADTQEALIGCLAEMSASLGENWTDRENWISAAKRGIRQIECQSLPWLFIYDNVVDIYDIADLLPSHPVSLIITSQIKDFGMLGEKFGMDNQIDLVSFQDGSRPGRFCRHGIANTLHQVAAPVDQITDT